MIFSIFIKFISNPNYIFPSPSTFNLFNKFRFFIRKSDIMNSTTFKVKINFVNQIEFININSTKTKKVFLNQFKISLSERPTPTRILIFNFSLNPCILNNIKEGLISSTFIRPRTMPSIFWSVKCMTHFMKNHKII